MTTVTLRQQYNHSKQTASRLPAVVDLHSEFNIVCCRMDLIFAAQRQEELLKSDGKITY